MLEQLQRAHAALLAAIADLEELTGEAAPDPAKLAQVRWRLSRASGERRRLVEAACERLRKHATPSQAEAIEALRGTSSGTVATSSRHVSRWTLDAVLADWEGYRQASADMRRAMRQRIAAEQAALYPLLQMARH